MVAGWLAGLACPSIRLTSSHVLQLWHLCVGEFSGGMHDRSLQTWMLKHIGLQLGVFIIRGTCAVSSAHSLGKKLEKCQDSKGHRDFQQANFLKTSIELGKPGNEPAESIHFLVFHMSVRSTSQLSLGHANPHLSKMFMYVPFFPTAFCFRVRRNTFWVRPAPLSGPFLTGFAGSQMIHSVARTCHNKRQLRAVAYVIF